MFTSFRSHFIFRQWQNLLLASFLTLFSASLAQALEQDSGPKACVAKESEVASLNPDISLDVYAEGDYEHAVAQLLKASRFKELDCLADSLRSSKVHFATGEWKLSSFYEAVSEPLQHPTQEDWDFTLSQLKNWGSQHPSSITAQIALADAYINYAWFARGEDTSDTVSQKGWELYGQRIAHAKAILDHSVTFKTKCPEWYSAMQSVALAQSWDLQAARALLEKAIKFEPTYYTYYRTYAYFLQPQWHGEEGDSEKFANEIADRIGGDDGDIVYAQTVARIVCICNAAPVLKNLSWPRTQKGFALMERRYGSSLHNLNRLAVIAWKFDDPVAAVKIFPRIEDQWAKDVWNSKKNFDIGKQWATEMAPMVAQDRERDQEAENNFKSPGGAEYKATVQKTFISLIQDCINSANPPLKEMVFMLRVSKDGGFEGLYTVGGGQGTPCMFQKLGAVYNAGGKPFPPPTHPSYLIKMTINPQPQPMASK